MAGPQSEIDVGQLTTPTANLGLTDLSVPAVVAVNDHTGCSLPVPDQQQSYPAFHGPDILAPGAPGPALLWSGGLAGRELCSSVRICRLAVHAHPVRVLVSPTLSSFFSASVISTHDADGKMVP